MAGVKTLLCFSQSKHNWSVEQLEGPDPYYEKDRAVFETILFETNDFRFEYNKDWHLSFHEHSLIIHDLHSFISDQESFHLYLNDLSKCPTCRSHGYKNKTDDSILSSHKQFLIQEAKHTAGLVCDGCYSYCEYYKIDTWDDDDRSSTEGEAEFIVSKHRNGGLETIRLRFVPSLGKFEDIEIYDSPYEFHSKMNAAANDDTFKPDTDQPLSSTGEEESDLPF